MKVQRQFERRGSLWVPRYDVERPWERYQRRWQRHVAAIAFDAASSNSGGAVSSLTITGHVVGSGSNRVLIVGASVAQLTGPTPTVTGVTFGGVALTQIATSESPNTLGRTDLWYLLNPATSTADIVVTWSAASDFQVRAGGISLSGVKQQAPEASNTASADSSAALSVSVTTLTNDAWVIDAAHVRGGGAQSLTVGAGQTQRYNVSPNAGPLAGSTEPQPTAGATTMSWTAQTANTWEMVAAAFAPAVTDRLGANFYMLGSGPTQMGGRIG